MVTLEGTLGAVFVRARRVPRYNEIYFPNTRHAYRRACGRSRPLQHSRGTGRIAPSQTACGRTQSLQAGPAHHAVDRLQTHARLALQLLYLACNRRYFNRKSRDYLPTRSRAGSLPTNRPPRAHCGCRRRVRTLLVFPTLKVDLMQKLPTLTLTPITVRKCQ